MVSTRSSTGTPDSGSSDSTVANPAQQQRPQSLFEPPPAREEQLLNQQLNAQPDLNLAALLMQQSQVLQQMQQSLTILAGNIQSLQPAAANSVTTPTPSMQAPVASAAISAMTPPRQASVAPAGPAYTDDPCKRIKLDIPKFDGKNTKS